MKVKIYYDNQHSMDCLEIDYFSIDNKNRNLISMVGNGKLENFDIEKIEKIEIKLKEGETN